MRVLNKITKKHADKKKAFSSARLKEEDRAKFADQEHDRKPGTL